MKVLVTKMSNMKMKVSKIKKKTEQVTEKNEKTTFDSLISSSSSESEEISINNSPSESQRISLQKLKGQSDFSQNDDIIDSPVTTKFIDTEKNSGSLRGDSLSYYERKIRDLEDKLSDCRRENEDLHRIIEKNNLLYKKSQEKIRSCITINQQLKRILSGEEIDVGSRDYSSITDEKFGSVNSIVSSTPSSHPWSFQTIRRKDLSCPAIACVNSLEHLKEQPVHREWEHFDKPDHLLLLREQFSKELVDSAATSSSSKEKKLKEIYDRVRAKPEYAPLIGQVSFYETNKERMRRSQSKNKPKIPKSLSKLVPMNDSNNVFSCTFYNRNWATNLLQKEIASELPLEGICLIMGSEFFS
uniref:BEN domain-containing protein n=1 Tax=Trichogramma kaykai TaxID=54128 RepID=A0ABD2W884_9HYME